MCRCEECAVRYTCMFTFSTVLYAYVLLRTSTQDRRDEEVSHCVDNPPSLQVDEQVLDDDPPPLQVDDQVPHDDLTPLLVRRATSVAVLLSFPPLDMAGIPQDEGLHQCCNPGEGIIVSLSS